MLQATQIKINTTKYIIEFYIDRVKFGDLCLIQWSEPRPWK